MNEDINKIAQQVSELIDNQSDHLTLDEYIDLLNTIISDCETRKDAAAIDLENEQNQEDL